MIREPRNERRTPSLSPVAAEVRDDAMGGMAAEKRAQGRAARQTTTPPTGAGGREAVSDDLREYEVSVKVRSPKHLVGTEAGSAFVKSLMPDMEAACKEHGLKFVSFGCKWLVEDEKEG